MDTKRLGAILTAAGIVILVVFGFADQFGYGDEGFGWVQWVGVIVGAVATVLGLGAFFQGRRAEPALDTTKTPPQTPGTST